MPIQQVPANMIGISQTTASQAVAINPGAVIYEQPTTLTASYCITTGTNAITKSPFKIADGKTLTVPDGSYWVVI
jgi:hypothetical protein